MCISALACQARELHAALTSAGRHASKHQVAYFDSKSHPAYYGKMGLALEISASHESCCHLAEYAVHDMHVQYDGK